MSINISRLFSRLLQPRRDQRQPYVHPKRPGLKLNLFEDRVVPARLVADVLSGTPSTTVMGTVYEDLDQNGVRNNGENGISGWTVYLDLDNSGTLNRDAVGDLEPSAVTNQDGDYVINRLIPGTYRVAEVVRAGWTPTAAISQDVIVTRDHDTRANFYNFAGGDITGTVWNDLNEDGVRATDEPGLSGWTVFLDANNNELPDPGEPATYTDTNGEYNFTNLPADDYEVTVELPVNWDISPGFDNRQTVTVNTLQTSSQDYAFFSTTNGSIQGLIWNDLNADGVRQTDPTTGAFTEPPLSGWNVFLDTNNNGVADPGELSTVTDTNGNYSFISLTAGNYEVTEELPPNWDVSPGFDSRQTVSVVGGEASTAGDFANFSVENGSIRGTIWNDVNRNGVRDRTIAGAFTEPGLAGWAVYLDSNGNGVADPTEPTATTDSAGSYSFSSLQVGDYDVREVLPTGWEPTTGYGDNVNVTVYSGTESVAPDFANFNLSTATPGSVSGTVWNDLNGNGVRDASSGAFTDPGLAGRTVFVDRNLNGVLDATELSAVSATDGSYTIDGVLPGSITVVEQAASSWRYTSPSTGSLTIALRNGETAAGLDFGNWALQDSVIRGTVFADSNANSARDAGERGLAGITVYLDLNNNGSLEAAEPRSVTSADQFYTPTVDEAGNYSFTHLAAGTYTIRAVLPEVLSATPAEQRTHTVTLTAAEERSVDTAARYRPTEIHGIKFDDLDADHIRDADEPVVAGATIFVDLDRDNVRDPSEPTTTTGDDGSYTFTGLTPGAYVVREELESGHQSTYPQTVGGILWPTGTSNAAVGNVTPTSITTSLSQGESFSQTVSITLPNSGALTNLVDVFLLFDDTGSFVNNSPIVRSAFPTIISQLQSSLPGIDLGFGVGRFEEYGNFAAEYATGRPFILNQPIVSASTTGYMTAIQAALNRTTPGYGGDGPETDIEALYQLVTGVGFDGNNNGSVLDSGAAGRAATQLTPGSSGDVPSFASFQADPTNNVMAAAGTVGGGGFRSGALPVILLATDIGFAYQPNGETTINGVGGTSLPVSAFTQTSRSTTPYNSGAGIQETITGLNALGGLVIGLGTNPQPNVDPRQGLEAISTLTGAVNRSTSTIANGTADPIAPGDPFYFQIASGFASSVSNGVVTAIQNAVTNVAVDITVQASDPRVRIINHTGVRTGIGSGQTATFDIEFVGNGMPSRFDLQFVRSGTNVILGSIPVVIGTPIPGDGYEYEELEDGEVEVEVDFGSHHSTTSNSPTIAVNGGSFTYDANTHSATATATGIGGAAVSGSFAFTYNGSANLPVNAGTYNVVATFTSTDPNYTNATGSSTLTITTASPTIAVNGGSFTYDANTHSATATATGIGGAAVSGSFAFTYNGSATLPVNAGTYNVVATFTSTDANYADQSATGTIEIQKATPAISNLNAPIIDEWTPSVTITGQITAGAAVPAGSSVTATLNGVTQSGLIDALGNFSLTFVSETLPEGTYPVVVSFAGDGANFNASTDGTTSVTVNSLIDATGLNVQATAGAPVTVPVATIVNALGASAYSATIAWGDGSTSIGVISGTGATLTVSGSHTYASPGAPTIHVTIRDTVGRGHTTTTTSTATVTTLGVDAGKTREVEYWYISVGQNLIRRFNGGPTRTELGNWLALNFPNLYGANAGANNLAGKTNLRVALFFQQLWRTGRDGAATQVLATALNVYATTTSLGGAQGAAAGFNVSATGHGARSYNVRRFGTAVGVPNYTRLNVYQMLRAVNDRSSNGRLYNGNIGMQAIAKSLFDELNSI